MVFQLLNAILQGLDAGLEFGNGPILRAGTSRVDIANERPHTLLRRDDTLGPENAEGLLHRHMRDPELLGDLARRRKLLPDGVVAPSYRLTEFVGDASVARSRVVKTGLNSWVHTPMLDDIAS